MAAIIHPLLSLPLQQQLAQQLRIGSQQTNSIVPTIRFQQRVSGCRQVLARCLAGIEDLQVALNLTKVLQARQWKPTGLQEIRLKQDLLQLERST